MNDQAEVVATENAPVQTAEVEKNEEQVSAPEKNAETPEAEIEAGSDEKNAQAVEKTYSQKEFDEATAKIRKKAEAVAERRALRAYAEKLEVMQQKPVAQVHNTKVDNGKPIIAQFGEDVEGYVEAVTKWTLRQNELETIKFHQAQQQAKIQTKAEKLYAEAEKVPGFDVETFESLLTPTIAHVILDSEIAPKLMAHISKNPDEIERIASLSPARQAAEIGKLEVKLSEVKQVKTSNAPAPLKPVGSKGGQTHKPVAEMSLAELRKFEEARGSRFI